MCCCMFRHNGVEEEIFHPVTQESFGKEAKMRGGEGLVQLRTGSISGNRV